MLHVFRPALYEFLPSRCRKLSATFRIWSPAQERHDKDKHHGPVAVNRRLFCGHEAVLAYLSRSTQLRRDYDIHLIPLDVVDSVASKLCCGVS